jgi:ferredoxin
MRPINPEKNAKIILIMPNSRIIHWVSGTLAEEKIMKVRIEDSCTACGLCVDTCPDVFEMGDEIAEVIVDNVPPELEETAQQAADECPVEAIVIE